MNVNTVNGQEDNDKLAEDASLVGYVDGGMNFGDAIGALKAGYRVAREGWNGKGMWLRMIHPYAPHPDTGGGAGSYSNPYFKAADNNPQAIGTMLPWIGMKTADNHFVPWLASQTDILAEDWMIVKG